MDRAAVAEWAAAGIVGTDPARARLLGEVMRPAATIAAWQHLAPPTPAALQGLVLERHPICRAKPSPWRCACALEDPERSAALVTRDRQLARRVAAELRRWGIEVDDSAGTPLDQTPPGAFLLLTARLVTDGVTPVALLAALKHPFAARPGPGRCRDQARALERACLRGLRLAGGFPACWSSSGAPTVASRATSAAAAPRLADRVRRAAGGGRARFSPWPGPRSSWALLRAHLAFAEALARPDRGFQSAVGARSRRGGCGIVHELLDAADLEHRIAPAAYPALLGQLMAARPVRSRAPKHPRLHIWGQLEARLQHADLLLLGGLNEGTWPALVDPGPGSAAACAGARAQPGRAPDRACGA